MIVAVRFHGSSAAPLALSAARRLFTIGASSDCDLVIPAAVAHCVAAVHGIVERTAAGLVVRDHQGHGLRRSPRSPLVAELHLHAGAVGWIGDAPIMALDAALVALRPRLALSVGLDAHQAVDDALAAAATGEALALVGPRGLDALPLARAIHDAGPAGAGAFTLYDGAAVPQLDGVDGTIAIDLDRVRRLPRAQVAAMLDVRCAARVIFLAGRIGRFASRLDTFAPRVRVVDLVPLERRADEIVRVLGLVWRDELGSDRSVDALGARSLRGLTSHRWRRNLDELREQSARILAYSMHPSLRRAARELGVKHQTLAGHLRRIGVEIIQQTDREPVLEHRPRSERASP